MLSYLDCYNCTQTHSFSTAKALTGPGLSSGTGNFNCFVHRIPRIWTRTVTALSVPRLIGQNKRPNQRNCFTPEQSHVFDPRGGSNSLYKANASVRRPPLASAPRCSVQQPSPLHLQSLRLRHRCLPKFHGRRATKVLASP